VGSRRLRRRGVGRGQAFAADRERAASESTVAGRRLAGVPEGTDKFVVTTRRIGDDPGAWSDPVAAGEPTRPPEQVTFDGGVLDGATGELVTDPNSVPHVWGMTDTLVMTVAGDLSRGELLRVAQSLRVP
jgi:hypothetical protein